jgi:hypothetical protein
VKRPTRKRSAATTNVDYKSLLSYIIRRCGTGCSPDYYLVVADNFFDNSDFSDDVRNRVCQMLKDRFNRIASKSISFTPIVLNGSTICSKCGCRVDRHPKQGHLTILCNGQKIRVSE